MWLSVSQGFHKLELSTNPLNLQKVWQHMTKEYMTAVGLMLLDMEVGLCNWNGMYIFKHDKKARQWQKDFLLHVYHANEILYSKMHITL